MLRPTLAAIAALSVGSTNGLSFGVAPVNSAVRVTAPARMVATPPVRRILEGDDMTTEKPSYISTRDLYPPKCTLAPAEVIWELAQGNKAYLETRGQKATGTSGEKLVDKLVADPLNPQPLKGLVVSCARSFAPIDAVFNTSPGDLQHIRLCGNVCAQSDGAVGSVEFALERSSPPVLMVMGNSRSDIVAAAVRKVLTAAGKTEGLPPAPKLHGDTTIDDLTLLNQVALAAEDALMQSPTASFDELCTITSKLNVWKSIESLLTTSALVAERVLSGELQVHGSFYDVDTGRVTMLGLHPSQAVLTSKKPTTDLIRTADDPPVPAEEARAALFAGNRRFSVGNGGKLKTMDEELLIQLTEGGQNPIAIVLGCADSRAPIEILFDVRPGDLFVLRNAGNTCASSKGSLIGSAEYAIGNLNTKYLVVTGHTKCGAVTAAVQTAAANADTGSIAGSIGKVLDDIVDCAREALALLPDATLADQVTLATKLNVFATMRKLIEYSPIVRDAVVTGDLQLDGAVYDIFNGEVEWLGEHPDLPEIIGKPLPYFAFKNQPFQRDTQVKVTGRSAVAENALQRLRRGNQRFVDGVFSPISASPEVPDPFAIVVGGGEVRVPIEKIFDVQPGDLVVQRCMGNIAGKLGGSLMASLEFAVTRYDPKVLVVLADGKSRIIQTALEQIRGSGVPSAAMQYVMDRVMVSAMRSIKQVDADQALTAAGRDMKIQQLTVELNAFYTIEQLLRSKIIRSAVQTRDLELHGAVLNPNSGVVDFIGEHPALEAFTDESRYA